MPRGVGYKSLPDNEGNDHREEHDEVINPERTSVPSAHPQEEAAIADHSPNDAGLKGEGKLLKRVDRESHLITSVDCSRGAYQKARKIQRCFDAHVAPGD